MQKNNWEFKPLLIKQIMIESQSEPQLSPVERQVICTSCNTSNTVIFMVPIQENSGIVTANFNCSGCSTAWQAGYTQGTDDVSLLGRI